jgi:hypothetical protein
MVGIQIDEERFGIATRILPEFFAGRVKDAPVSFFPNPGDGRFSAALTLERAGDLRVFVMNGLGQTVAIVSTGHRGAGSHVVEIDIGHLPGGVYFCRIDTGDGLRTGAYVLVKR